VRCRVGDAAGENLLVATGIQQDILDPILGLFGPLGGLFTS
jgi:hypothetical protein